MKLFWKVFVPLAACLVVTIIILGWIAIRVVPAQIREFQRRTIEEFRVAVLTDERLSVERAIEWSPRKSQLTLTAIFFI